MRRSSTRSLDEWVDELTHYFDSSRDVGHRRRTVPLAVGDRRLELVTDRGVFSSDAVDLGTAILIDTVPPPPPAGDLLDLGCGYGPIALAMAVRAPAATVWAVDVNDRALQLTRDNAAAAGLDNIRVSRPEDVPGGTRFAAAWSNPPIRIGKQPLHDLLLHWLARLDGAAFLVVQRHLGSDSLAAWLSEQGFPTTRVRSKKAFRVLQVSPPPPRRDVS